MRLTGRHRLWALGAVAGLVVVGVLATRKNGPYDFLEQFHPEHIDVNWTKMPPASRPPHMPRITVLVFRNTDHEAVLAALKRELTPERDYTTSRDPTPGEEDWQFNRTERGGTPMPYGAHYSFGPRTTVDLAELRTLVQPGSDVKPRGPTAAGQPSCIVEIAEEATWSDNLLAKLRGLVHL